MSRGPVLAVRSRERQATLDAGFFRSTFLAWVTLAAGLAASISASLEVKRVVEQDAVRRFAFTCDQIALKISERLDAYALILRGAAGLFAASEFVSRREWRQYVETMRPQNSVPGVQGIGFAEFIPAAELPAHVARLRAEGFSGYGVRPPGAREVYTSIVYLEPFAGRNLRAFGYDMFSEPVRRAAMEQARDTGDAALSGKVVPAQETGQESQAGTLMYFPVYRRDAPTGTVELRQAALLGWTYSAYPMNDLMQGMLADWTSSEGNLVDLHIFDGDHLAIERLLFDSRPAYAPDMRSPFYQQRTVNFNGRRWLLAFDGIGATRSIDYSGAWATLAGGALLSGVLCVLMLSLIGTRMRAERIARKLTGELRESESRFRQMFELNESVMLLIDPDSGAVVDANGAAARFYGYPAQLLKTLNVGDITMVSPEDLKAELARAVRHERNFFVIPNRLADGEIRTVEIRSSPIMTGGRRLLITIIHDITARLDAEEQVRQMAFHDALTKLPNRRLFNDRLGQAQAASRRSGCYCALMFLDLDNFKPLNDAEGHEVGDLLLIEVAGRIKACVRETDTVARFGGDEFVVMLSELKTDKGESAEEARAVAEKIRAALAEPYRLAIRREGEGESEVLHRCTASIGLTLLADHETTNDDFLKWADRAMYQAKAAGGNVVRFYDPSAHPGLAKG